jgi:exopolysaccharide biosynthesis polyprenyl glycosylphosphotransferase
MTATQSASTHADPPADAPRLLALESRREAPSSLRDAHLVGKEVAKQREALYRRSLVLADAMAMAIAMFLCFEVIGADRLRPWAVLAPLVLVVAAKVAGLYDRDEIVLRRSTVDELPKLAQLAAVACLVAWIGETALVFGRLGKDQAVGFFLLLLVGLFVGRWTARRLSAKVAPRERCLVIGDTDHFDRLHEKLRGHCHIELVSRLPLATVVHDIGLLIDQANEHRIERLVIAPPVVGLHEETMNLIRAAKATGLRVSIIPSVLDVVGSAVEFDELPGLTLLGVKRFGLSRSSLALKRGLDVAGSTVALLIFGPFMLAAAAAIKLDSPGPVLFRQTRVGREGQRFEIFKFRTMVDGADAMRSQLAHLNEAQDGLFKIGNDPRLTRYGRFLRRTSLDELPQLLNVLRGEMSLVGPRPLVIDEDERVTGFARQRLMLTPGMTGEWQIAGSARVPFVEMVKIDYLYVASWSLWSDIKVLMRTVPYMLARRGQ